MVEGSGGVVVVVVQRFLRSIVNRANPAVLARPLIVTKTPKAT